MSVEPLGPSALTLEFLVWISSEPRTYGETMEAWRTNCPRMPIWENAVSDGLVALEGGGSMRARKVALTPKGYSILKEAWAGPADHLREGVVAGQS
jgi:hypothetical protein